MASVLIEITRFVDDHFPGFVECVLTDAQGRAHAFIEKLPVVTLEHLSSDSEYPCAGVIPCEIESEFSDSTGRLLARITTDRPDAIESTSGETKFVVLSSQLIR